MKLRFIFILLLIISSTMLLNAEDASGDIERLSGVLQRVISGYEISLTAGDVQVSGDVRQKVYTYPITLAIGQKVFGGSFRVYSQGAFFKYNSYEVLVKSGKETVYQGEISQDYKHLWNKTGRTDTFTLREGSIIWQGEVNYGRKKRNISFEIGESVVSGNFYEVRNRMVFDLFFNSCKVEGEIVKKMRKYYFDIDYCGMKEEDLLPFFIFYLYVVIDKDVYKSYESDD